MADRNTVTFAWHTIHQRHPGVYRTVLPRAIGRMRFRDFPNLLLATCRPAAAARFLEVGCGSGRDSLYFSSLGYFSVAVDVNLTPLVHLLEARDAIHRRDALLQLHGVAGDAFHLPFADGTFDVVFNSGLIEHYHSDTRRLLLREMRRVAKPEGFVVLAFPNTKHILRRWWERLIHRYTDFDRYNIPEQEVQGSLRDELSSAGLAPILFDWIDCYDTLSHFPRWMPLRIIAFTATAILPRPPLALRRKTGTRVMVIARNAARAA